MKRRLWIYFILMAIVSPLLSKGTEPATHPADWTGDAAPGWLAGTGAEKITPQNEVWLAGYARKRPPEGILNDLWAKVLMLRAPGGKQAVFISLDLIGLSKTVYDMIYEKVHAEFGTDRSELMISYSHTHSGPRVFNDLVDYYPSDDDQQKEVEVYCQYLLAQIERAVHDASTHMQPATVYMGEGQCGFAVNRRENKEADVPSLREKNALKGPVDHSVPVLSVKSASGKRLAILFGYACHATTMDFNSYSGDYPGFAQQFLEERFPGTTALFFAGCGGDQNPLPRGSVELCKSYGKMLSDAVTAVVEGPMKPLKPSLKTAFQYVSIPYQKLATRDTLIKITQTENEYRVRWARKMLYFLDKGMTFPPAYSYYPLQAWNLGNKLLFISMGGETVVDYDLIFKSLYGSQATWVCGFANTLVAYIPSKRIIDEGGYEGAHLDEYGHPAWSWSSSIEHIICDAVGSLVHKVDYR